MRISDWSSDVCSSDLLAELLKKTQIVVEEQPQIVDAVAQHRHALHAHAERVAGIFFGIDTDRLQHLRMHDAAAQHFQPARAVIRLGPADVYIGADRKSTRLNSSH